MRIKVFPFRFAVCVLGALCFFGAPAFAQGLEAERGLERETLHSDAPATTTESNATTNSSASIQHSSEVHDWTHQHLLYPRVGPPEKLIAVQNDPRAIQHWQESYRKDRERERGRRGEGFHHHRTALHPDWQIAIGGTVDDAMYPAKWTFDVNETVTATSCVGSGSPTLTTFPDYLVAPVDASGTVPGGAAVGQPDIVGLNNLYSGTAPGPTGFCNRGTPVNDDGVSATVLFSYAIVADGGNVTTSPTVSLDGSLIAFVEQGAANAHFHVLAWKAGDGVNAGNAQDALGGVAGTITTFSSTVPTAQSGAVTDLSLTDGVTSALDTLSSPFVDYLDDVAFVGNDAGQIFRIRPVFCPSWNPCPSTGFPLSAAAAAVSGNTTYTGTFNFGGAIAVGATVTVAGFTNAANNGTFTVVASTSTQLTLNNPSGVAETNPASASVVTFPLSAAATASGGNTVYTGTFSPMFLPGASATIAGFANAGNNGTFTVVSSTFTQLTLNNPGGVAETLAATAQFSDVPRLDTAFGSGGVLTIATAIPSSTCTGGTSQLTGVVQDRGTGNIYVGCSDGNLYGFTSAGVPLATSSLAIGDGSLMVGFPYDPPTLDVVNGWVYDEAMSGNDGANLGIPVLVQASLDLATNVTIADLVPTLPPPPNGGSFPMHSPAFNDAYFTSNSAADWLLYAYSSDSNGGISLWGIPFTAGPPTRLMTGGIPPNANRVTSFGAIEVSPVTEFLTTGGEDRIFASVLTTGNGNLVSWLINSALLTAPKFPSAVESFVPNPGEGAGTSGIVVDNSDTTDNQANSIYCGVFGAAGTDVTVNSVVKLTQSGLQ